MYFINTQINKICTLIFFLYLHRMFIEYIQKSIPKVTLGILDFLQIKSLF